MTFGPTKLSELATLRVGVARLAQAMIRSHRDPDDRIAVAMKDCGLHSESDYSAICDQAQSRQRGWNALLGAMAETMY